MEKNTQHLSMLTDKQIEIFFLLLTCYVSKNVKKTVVVCTTHVQISWKITI